MAQKKETQPQVGGDNFNVTIGDSARQVAVGKNIHQVDNSITNEVSAADLEQVGLMFDELKRQIEQQAPPNKKAAALKQVDKLQQEITAKKPEAKTITNVNDWFTKNLPALLGSVTALLVNPLVGKVVEAGSSMAADALKRQFGPKQA